MTTKADPTQANGAESSAGSGGITRRKFLQILGSASAVGAVGCADRNEQAVFPNVRGDDQLIPGIEAWFSSTCTECSAGCGIQVRTKDGRAVKIEGNPDSPINRGSLCALGQSALQGLYDPDRVRQPLKRVVGNDGKAAFVPVSWDEAFRSIANGLKESGKKALISGELPGALGELSTQFTRQFGIEHAVYEPEQRTALAKAAELVYGVYGIPSYSFDKAEVVLNFGADFLESWVSPCEFSRGWAASRRAAKPARVIHVEPRLSLTGANADSWLKTAPGTEVLVGLAILKLLVESGKGSQLGGEVFSSLRALTSKVSLADVAARSGVPREKLLLTADYIKGAKRSLVVAGGTVSASAQPLPLLVIANLLNLVLDNVGGTVNLNGVRSPQGSLSGVLETIASIDRGEVSLLLLHSTNPAFSLPPTSRFSYAIKKVPLVVAFSTHLDETATQADLVLPPSTSLESWGDVRPLPGVYSLIQPAMTPVFDTRSFGDMLLGIAGVAGVSSFAQGATDFLTFLKRSWEGVQREVGAAGDFESFWNASVERGGVFTKANGSANRGRVNPQVFSIKFDTHQDDGDELVLYPFVSVKSFDGGAANRPWLQELPDPITSIVWDSWAEIHPETAKARGIERGDLVTIRNQYGELNVPAYLSEHVHPRVIAVPIGQGHAELGRYAKKVGGGNVNELFGSLDAATIAENGDVLPRLTPGVTLLRGRGKPENGLVMTQFSDSQGARELARFKYIDDAPAQHAEHHHEHGEDHGAHHEPKQMYQQREHPLYEWAMTVDLNACTGCAACVVACYAENNIPVVGKKLASQGREMSWLRIERYMDEGPGEELQVNFMPMMCQHCHNAPCEPVCPVYATYHNDEGLNVMVYNRCVGTRYCSNNCSYKVRRFNFAEITLPEPLTWQLNPDVTRRVSGVMEKCSFCVQRIGAAKDRAKDLGRPVEDGEVTPACVQTCPTGALSFGNRNDPNSRVRAIEADARAYKVLDHHLNTQPAVSYLERIKYKA